MTLRNAIDRISEIVIFAVALVAMAIIFLIFIYVGREALPLITGNSEGLTLASPFTAPYVWQPVSNVPKYNVFPLIMGTLKVTVIAMLIAIPLALAAALYTAEFAPPRLRDWIKPAIELLAGIPSVVLGFFALMVLATWVQAGFGIAYRLNAVVAGLA